MSEETKEQEPTSRAVRRDKLIRLILRALPVPFVPGPEIYDLLRDLQRSRAGLDGKVRRAMASLEEASALVTELQDELSDRVVKVGKLREEYEKYEQLAQIEERKAEALIKQLEATVGHGRSRERWVALGINLVAGLIVFILGVLLGPWLKQLLGIGG